MVRISKSSTSISFFLNRTLDVFFFLEAVMKVIYGSFQLLVTMGEIFVESKIFII